MRKTGWTFGALTGVTLGVGTAVAVALMSQGEPGAPQMPLDPDRTRIIDLTHAFDGETLYWPTAPHGFRHEPISVGETQGGWFYSAFALAAPEHGGTHLDAPYHFSAAGERAEEISLERLIGPAVVIDVSEQAAAERDYRLSREDVRGFEREYGRIEAGSIVLLRTGWDARWPDPKAYLGDDRPGRTDDLHFPSFGEAAARLLVEERGVAALGVDTASLDYGPSQDFPVHRIAAARNVPGFENLANLDVLPPRGALIVALPMKIAGGSGAPLRAAALLTEMND